MAIPAKNSSFFPHMVVGEVQKPSQQFSSYLISYDISPSALFDEINSNTTADAVEMRTVIEPFINGLDIILTKSS